MICLLLKLYMPRYFLEVSYKGTAYSGFQVQKNANTIQSEIEKAFTILQRQNILLTGSSRTDAGVHALQNFFHFDFDEEINPHFTYKINAILPGDIVVKKIREMQPEAHCRFDAISREYKYLVYRHKDPFLSDRAFFFPYKLDIEVMQKAAGLIKNYTDFASFSKRNTQVKTFDCEVEKSEWYWEKECLIYNTSANRFLRGMVRALVATMLKIGRGKMTIDEFKNVIEQRDCTKASFAVPPHGLFLVAVNYPRGYFQEEKK